MFENWSKSNSTFKGRYRSNPTDWLKTVNIREYFVQLDYTWLSDDIISNEYRSSIPLGGF